MNAEHTPESSNRLARTTGVLYFLVILTGITSAILVQGFGFEPGDMAATVNQIRAHEFAYRLAFVVSLTRLVFLTLLILVLYKLLGPVNRDAALVMVAFALISVAVVMLSLVFRFSAPLLLTSSDYSSLVAPNALQAQVQFFMDMHNHADKAAQILTVWVVMVGFLVLNSQIGRAHV